MNAKQPGNVCVALAPSAHLERFVPLIERQLAWSPQMLARFFGSSPAFSSAFPDQGTFELCQTAEHSEDEATCWCGGVCPRIGKRTKLAALRFDPMDNV